MIFLSFFPTYRWWAEPGVLQTQPGVATWAGGIYSVLIGWSSDSAPTELLVTRDPIEAVVHVARLLSGDVL